MHSCVLGILYTHCLSVCLSVIIVCSFTFFVSAVRAINLIYELEHMRYNENVVAEMFVVVFRSLTIMLVVVSSYSLVITFPRLLAMAMNPVNTPGFTIHMHYFFSWATRIIAPWNYCGNFFFYILSGKQFRKELKLLFCCGKRSPGVSDFNAVLCVVL